jgi:uncharacterized membrane protein
MITDGVLGANAVGAGESNLNVVLLVAHICFTLSPALILTLCTTEKTVATLFPEIVSFLVVLGISESFCLNQNHTSLADEFVDIN